MQAVIVEMKVCPPQNKAGAHGGRHRDAFETRLRCGRDAVKMQRRPCTDRPEGACVTRRSGEILSEQASLCRCAPSAPRRTKQACLLAACSTPSPAQALLMRCTRCVPASEGQTRTAALCGGTGCLKAPSARERVWVLVASRCQLVSLPPVPLDRNLLSGGGVSSVG